LRHPSLRCRADPAEAEQVRLVHALERRGRNAEHDRRPVQAEGAALAPRLQDLQVGPVHRAEAAAVDPQPVQGPGHRGQVDPPATGGDRIGAHPPEQAKRLPRGLPRDLGQFPGGVGIDLDADARRGGLNHLVKLVGAVEPQAFLVLEAAEEGLGQQSLVSRRPNQRERGEPKGDRAGPARAHDQEVQAAIVDGPVEHLGHRLRQRVNLVDEHGVALTDLGEEPDQTQGVLEKRPAGGMEACAQLAGESVSDGCLAEAGSAAKQRVAESLVQSASGLESDLQ
jgi:hypothetical protein